MADATGSLTLGWTGQSMMPLVRQYGTQRRLFDIRTDGGSCHLDEAAGLVLAIEERPCGAVPGERCSPLRGSVPVGVVEGLFDLTYAYISEHY